MSGGFSNTRGILFFGTPHNGSRVADWAAMLVKMLRALPGVYVNPKIVEDLREQNASLDRLQQDFLGVLKRRSDPTQAITVHCFFEQLETHTGPFHNVGCAIGFSAILTQDQIVVPQQSAVMENAASSSLHADHAVRH